MKLLILLLFPVLIFGQSVEIRSPNPVLENDSRIKIFLGGTIDMGNSVNWQAQVIEELKNENVILLNPRREDWNPDWKPNVDEPEFVKQVQWELDALENADYIIMFFAASSLSPISLLEFGLYARSNKLLVVCEDGFWRKGNLQITAEKYNILQFDNLLEMIKFIKSNISINTH